MIDYSQLVKEESTADVITFLVRNDEGLNYIHIDRFFGAHDFSVIANGELLEVFERLRNAGVVEWGDKMWVRKGPNWKEPKFVTEKKYGIK